MKMALWIAIVLAGVACAPPPKLVWVNEQDPHRNFDDDARVCMASASAQADAQRTMEVHVPPGHESYPNEGNDFYNDLYFGCMKSVGWDRTERPRTRAAPAPASASSAPREIGRLHFAQGYATTFLTNRTTSVPALM